MYADYPHQEGSHPEHRKWYIATMQVMRNGAPTIHTLRYQCDADRLGVWYALNRVFMDATLENQMTCLTVDVEDTRGNLRLVYDHRNPPPNIPSFTYP